MNRAAVRFWNGNNTTKQKSTSMDEINVGGSTKLLIFNEKIELWYQWSRCFLERAEIMGYKDILDGNWTQVIVKDPLTDDDTHEDNMNKFILATKKAKGCAYNDLLTACNDYVSFSCVDEAHRDPFLEWTNLQEHFEPKTGSSKIQMTKQFSLCSLKSGQNPDEWFSQLEKIRYQLKTNYKFEFDDDYVIVHIMNNLPK